jgi:hypothetical protein
MRRCRRNATTGSGGDELVAGSKFVLTAVIVLSYSVLAILKAIRAGLKFVQWSFGRTHSHYQAWAASVLPPQQLRQLGDVGGDPACFVAGEQLGRATSEAVTCSRREDGWSAAPGVH